MTKDDNDELMHWVGEMNKRGTFAAQNPQDRAVVEASTANEWALAVNEKYGLHVTNARSCEYDPPDCLAESDGRSITIELSELVDSNRLRENIAAINAEQDPPHLHGQAFLDAQWSKDRFFGELSSLIDKKAMKYEKNNSVFDVLLVHSDEPWLSPQQVDEWLAEESIVSRTAFRSAYLLLTYMPGGSKHWQVFKLFGSLAAT